jgi:hypothetical protein
MGVEVSFVFPGSKISTVFVEVGLGTWVAVRVAGSGVGLGVSVCIEGARPKQPESGRAIKQTIRTYFKEFWLIFISFNSIQKALPVFG